MAEEQSRARLLAMQSEKIRIKSEELLKQRGDEYGDSRENKEPSK